MSFLDNYEDLIAFLEHPSNRANLAEAMRCDFHTFVIVVNLLIKRQRVIEYPFLLEAIELFQQLADGKLQTNLALFWPPGWGKTQIQIYFCAWCLIRNPEVHFLYTNCVYNSVKQRGGEILNIIKSRYTRLLFDISVDKSTASRTLFRINKASARSGFVGVAYEGGITGLDAGNPNAQEPKFTWQDKETEEAGNSEIKLTFGGGLVLDDALSSTHFRSEARKENCRNVYTGTLMSRIRGQNCKKIAVCQRLAIDDLGAVLKEHDAKGLDKWTFHEVQAYVNGKSTCGRVRSTEYLSDMSKMISLQEEFMAQYQQTPIPPTGGYIIDANSFNQIPFCDMQSLHYHQIIISLDTAFTEHKTSDYSVALVFGIIDNKMYLLDMLRKKLSFTNLKTELARLYLKHNATSMIIEESANGYAILDEFTRFPKVSNDKYFNLIPYKPRGSKLARVHAATSFITNKNITIPTDSSFVGDFLQEVTIFPFAKHDDVVDALTQMILWFNANGVMSKEEERKLYSFLGNDVI